MNNKWKQYYAYISEQRLFAEIKLMKQNFPYADLRLSETRKLYWLVNLTVSKGTFLVCLEYPSNYPSTTPLAYLLDPPLNFARHLKHTFHDGALCFYLTDWDTGYTATSCIPWIAKWLEEHY